MVLSLISTVDKGRLYLETRDRANKNMPLLLRTAERLSNFVADEPEDEAAVTKTADVVAAQTAILRPLLLELFSIHRLGMAIDLFDAQSAGLGTVPDAIEVDLVIAAEAVRSNVSRWYRVDDGLTPFTEALWAYAACVKRVEPYVKAFGKLQLRPETGEGIHYQLQRLELDR